MIRLEITRLAILPLFLESLLQMKHSRNGGRGQQKKIDSREQPGDSSFKRHERCEGDDNDNREYSQNDVNGRGRLGRLSKETQKYHSGKSELADKPCDFINGAGPSSVLPECQTPEEKYPVGKDENDS